MILKYKIVMLFALTFLASISGPVNVSISEEFISGIEGKTGDHEKNIVFRALNEDINANVSRSDRATDLEDRLKNKSRFYFIKFKFRDNIFSFNFPERTYSAWDHREKINILEYLTKLYGDSFREFKDIFGFSPRDYRFNVTFGKTKRGMPFNTIYLYNKISNIFPGFIPAGTESEVFSAGQKMIMFHEIGHSLFGIAIGTFRDPRTKAIEEGVVDYFAERIYKGKFPETYRRGKFQVSESKLERLEGLSQLDVESSVWVEEDMSKISGVKGYVGVTHHVFGLEFVKSFIQVFGEKDMINFLVRLRQTEEDSFLDDFGTNRIIHIFNKMGYTEEKIIEFKEELHRRLKANVFKVVN